MKKLLLTFVAMFAFVSSWAIDQDADGYYLIGSVDDWKAFANIVNTTPNANARMIAEVDLGDDQTMIGTLGVPYRGIFDGQGYTLAVCYVADFEMGAPFYVIGGATIRNLRTAGTIELKNKYHAAGIVGKVNNSSTNVVERCISSVTIVGNTFGLHGGLIGNMYFNSSLTLTDCIFNGEILGKEGRICSALVGRINPGCKLNASNCFINGTYEKKVNAVYDGELVAQSATNTYYVGDMIAAEQGATQATDEQLADGTIATALQAGRDEEVWVQDVASGMPMLKIIKNEPASVRGDLNGDGVVDVTDVSIAIDLVLGKDNPGLSLSAEADLDGNGVVDVTDVSMLIDLVLGKDVPEPTIRTFIVNGVSFKMVAVEGGTFTMGATDEQADDAYSDEKPAHQVTLSGFNIGETLVTQALWLAVMGNNPSYKEGDLNRPVESVSWNDCQTFISELNRLTRKKFRLPTEAEWEYAARGGCKSQGFKYAGSNNVNDVAWHWGNSELSTQPVATKAPNELGLYDMSGNVWEWCKDWRGDYSSEPCTNPTGPATGTLRILRGGSWSHTFSDCRVSVRNSSAPGNSNVTMGLRLAM